MKVFITGGTGFVGGFLTRRLAEAGHEMTLLTRSVGRARPSGDNVAYVQGDPGYGGDWQQAAAQADVAVNLAGESIFQRWSKSAKHRISGSRILATRNLVDAMLQGDRPGRTLLNASAVGYYGYRDDDELAEDAGPGDDFLARVCRDWETEACGPKRPESASAG